MIIKKQNLYSDQSSSSLIARRRSNALLHSKVVKKNENPHVAKLEVTQAQQRVRAGGAMVPNNVPHPHTLSPHFPIAPTKPKNTHGNLIQQMAMNRVLFSGCNSNWCR